MSDSEADVVNICFNFYPDTSRNLEIIILISCFIVWRPEKCQASCIQDSLLEGARGTVPVSLSINVILD